MAAKSNFELTFGELTLKVSEHEIKRQSVFHIVFPDGRKPLVLVEGLDAANNIFWTSVPEGRKNESDEIGKLLSFYLKK